MVDKLCYIIVSIVFTDTSRQRRVQGNTDGPEVPLYPVLVSCSNGLINYEKEIMNYKSNKKSKSPTLLAGINLKPKLRPRKLEENTKKSTDHHLKRPIISGKKACHINCKYSYIGFEIVQQKTNELKMKSEKFVLKEDTKFEMSDNVESSCEDHDEIEKTGQNVGTAKQSDFDLPVIILTPDEEDSSCGQIFLGRMINSTPEGQKVIELNSSLENQSLSNQTLSKICRMLNIKLIIQSLTKPYLNRFLTNEPQTSCSHDDSNCVVCDLTNQIMPFETLSEEFAQEEITSLASFVGNERLSYCESVRDEFNQQENLDNTCSIIRPSGSVKSGNDDAIPCLSQDVSKVRWSQLTEELKNTVVQEMKIAWQQCFERSKKDIIKAVKEELEQHQ